MGGKLVAIGNRKQEAVEGVKSGSGVKAGSGVKVQRKMEKKKNGTPVVRKQRVCFCDLNGRGGRRRIGMTRYITRFNLEQKDMCMCV